MERGEVWWADMDEPVGRRPVLLLSRNAAYRIRESVTVAPVTTRVRKIRTEVPVGPEEGLPREGVVNLDDILTISKEFLVSRTGALSAEKMVLVGAAIKFALNID